MKLPRVKLSSAPAGPNAFRRMIDSADRELRPGDLAAVYDRNGQPYGVGLFNPRSQIALRIFTRDNPETFDIDAWLAARVGRAVEFRRDVLRLPQTTNACRLVHDYGDGLPGLTADIYGDHLVLEFYSLGMFKMAASIEKAFRLHYPDAVFHHRATSFTQEMEGFELKPEATRPRVRINENGVLFEVTPSGGYKTGFFCDQRENRLLAASLAGGRSVVDLCAYTGGFGVYAAKLGGAKDVTCVELDPEASAQTKRNANINKVKVDAVCVDAFAYLRQMQANKRKFGLVVLDPYKVVSSREEKEKGLYKYKDFNRLAMALADEGAVFVTCSCSGMVSMQEFSQVVRAAAASSGKRLQIFKKTGAGSDHPVAADYPEGEYLKAIWARVY